MIIRINSDRRDKEFYPEEEYDWSEVNDDWFNQSEDIQIKNFRMKKVDEGLVMQFDSNHKYLNHDGSIGYTWFADDVKRVSFDLESSFYLYNKLFKKHQPLFYCNIMMESENEDEYKILNSINQVTVFHYKYTHVILVHTKEYGFDSLDGITPIDLVDCENHSIELNL